MDPLRAVEDILGNVDSWPTYIICDLFVTERNTISVKHVAAVMYGNGVPIEKAIDCFIICIGIDSYYVSCAMRDWYSIWDNAAHETRYYSMASKRGFWINGIELRPEVTVTQFGIENTGCQQIISDNRSNTFLHIFVNQ
jgi:hypothetical protein